VFQRSAAAARWCVLAAVAGGCGQLFARLGICDDDLRNRARTSQDHSDSLLILEDE